ncbi:MAG: hypothetical protein ABJP45_00710 [Cyclobacteriaceae bacterium]
MLVLLTILGTFSSFLADDSLENRSILAQQIPPDHVRARGIILSIFSKPTDTGKCQQLRCWALVEVVKIEGYGSGFTGALSPKDTIQVKFSRTLESTKYIFPNDTNHLPGLKVSEVFVADVKQRISPLQAQNTNTYEIKNYTLMN